MAKAILLAEDSPDDEFLFVGVLKRNRVANPITVVRDGEDVIAYLSGTGKFADREKFPLPGVLFLDLKMAKVDGFEVLQWLAAHPDVKKKLLIVVLSQFGDASQIRRAYDMGANSFLPKPFTYEDSENLIKHFDGYWVRSEGSTGAQ